MAGLKKLRGTSGYISVQSHRVSGAVVSPMEASDTPVAGLNVKVASSCTNSSTKRGSKRWGYITPAHGTSYPQSSLVPCIRGKAKVPTEQRPSHRIAPSTLVRRHTRPSGLTTGSIHLPTTKQPRASISHNETTPFTHYHMQESYTQNQGEIDSKLLDVYPRHISNFYRQRVCIHFGK